MCGNWRRQLYYEDSDSDLDPNPISLSQAYSMASRPTARAEKGVKKVIEHQVKENAATLLYALTKAIALDDFKLRKQFLDEITNKIDTVVEDFGFAKDRIRNEGDACYNDIVAAITTESHVTDLETKYRELGAVINTLKCGSPEGSVGESTGSSEDHIVDLSDNNAPTKTEGSATRSGPVRKRQQSVHEAFVIVNDMNTTLTAMKTHVNKKARRGSSIM